MHWEYFEVLACLEKQKKFSEAESLGRGNLSWEFSLRIFFATLLILEVL